MKQAPTVTVPMSLINMLGRAKKAQPVRTKSSAPSTTLLRPQRGAKPASIGARPSSQESKAGRAAPMKRKLAVRDFSHLLQSHDADPEPDAAVSTRPIATAAAIVAAGAKARAPATHKAPAADTLAAKIIAAGRKGVRL